VTPQGQVSPCAGHGRGAEPARSPSADPFRTPERRTSLALGRRSKASVAKAAGMAEARARVADAPDPNRCDRGEPFMPKTAARRTLRAGAALAMGLAVASCAASVREKEDMLAAAGFRLRPADTPQRVAALTALPPHRFVRRTVDGRVTYLYADPTVCRCLYVGGQEAYGRYRQNVFEQRIANEQAMTAQMNEDFMWDWGPWGGPGWWYL
jgi:hypothetical protein